MGFRFLKLEIGSLKSRVAIQQAGPTRDAVTNEEIPSWPTIATAWMEIKPISGMGIVTGGSVANQTGYLVGMQYRFANDVQPQMRLSVVSGPYAGIVLDIVSSFDPDGEQMWTVCECKRGQA